MAFIDELFGGISPGWMNFLSLLGLTATLAGLFFTWREATNAATKAQDAEDAARSLREAVENATLRIARQDLIGSMAQARQLITQLDTAQQSKSTEFVVQTLVQLGDHFSQLQALITQDSTNLVPDEFADQLKRSQASVLSTKAKLARSPSPDIPKLMGNTLKHLAQLRVDFYQIETSSKYATDSQEG
ncbi:hypothetical protein [Leucobacter massiliensis]|uniref:hypothetical protein n=1 Tax=Leucobacter massiliensis TaxID=1686285 RepID=UPI0011B2102E|nr:hypothetical protein [Leucobacter massiliensis]